MRDTFEFENGPTISGVRVGTTEEAKYVLQQVLAGHLPEYRERLGHNGPTPNAGEVYVHNRHLINRWTDSLSWGTSRTRKGFRVYDAKNSNLTRKTLTVSPDDGKTRWQIVAYDYQNEVSCTADRHGVPLRSVKHRVPELLSRPAGVHRESVHPPLHSMPTGIYLPALASHTPPDSPLPLTPMDSPPPPAAHHDMYMVLDDEDDTSSERDSRGEQLIALPPLSALPQPLPHHPHHYHLHPKSPSPSSPHHFHLLPPPASGLHPLGSGAPPSSIRDAYDSAVIARFPL